MLNYTLIGAYIGASLSIGIGAVGSAVGKGYSTGFATEALTRQPQSSSLVLRTMLIGQAITETSSIFALLIALILLFRGGESSITTMIAFISSGLCIGLGALGSGIGSGLPVASACEGIGRKPENINGLMATMTIGQAVTQTAVIFALVISFSLFVKLSS